jgi:hypothetical protein
MQNKMLISVPEPPEVLSVNDVYWDAYGYTMEVYLTYDKIYLN